MCSRCTVAEAVGCIAGRVVQRQAGHCQASRAFDVKAVGGPILNVEIFDYCVLHILDDEEMVWLVLATIGALAIPYQPAQTCCQQRLLPMTKGQGNFQVY